MDFEIENYSVFAKMLACEDITLQVDENAKTASMNLKSRVLTVPEWDNMTRPVVRMLIGHEVSHAVNTPMKGWKNAVEEMDECDRGIFRNILNVVEDCRIDKLIIRKYPALRADYRASVRYFMENDFFGIEKRGEKIEDLAFVDRINVKFKTHWSSEGPKINFSKDELPYIRKTENLETFQEAVDLAKELFEKFKEDSKTQYEDLVKKYEEANAEQDDSNLGRMNLDEDDMKEGEGDEKEKKSAVSAPGVSDKPHPGITVEEFNKNSKGTSNPTNIGINKTNTGGVGIIHNNPVRNFYQDDWSNGFETNMEKIKDAKKRNAAFVSKFCSMFESKKRGRELSKIMESKTGMIDTNSLHSYRYSEEIFKSNQYTQNQKNHGFVVMIDCSGSMSSIFNSVVEQLFVFSMICERLNIPFIGVGFSDCFSAKGTTKTFSSYGNVTLQKLYDWRDGKKENNRKMSALLSGKMRLGGTPLSDSIALSKSLISDFRSVTGVDIVNFVLLTDGADGNYVNNTYIQDHETKTMVKNDLSPRGLSDNVCGSLKLIKKLLDVRVTYFDITSSVPHMKYISPEDIKSFSKNGILLKNNFSGIDNVIYASENVAMNKDSKILKVLVDSLS